ncbi:alpha/beta fold hydrolase [Amycolatopsis pigmentata]|uniref:Alpha/beta fold hydrolase n=1 Tax=Amycolatopsis pigmentata TaxID=450801 RepID=A0ABW5FNY3_9PSEU
MSDFLRKLFCSLTVVGAAVPLSSCGEVLAADASALTWAPCRTIVKDWDPGDERTECANVAVPLDYAKPDGRMMNLMISRIRATDPGKRRGVLLINPGGPGHPGLNMPAELSKSTVAGIGADHDLVGFDPRGVGRSGGKACDQDPADGPDPDPEASAEQRFRQGYRQTARRNVRCTGYDPEFIGGLSTEVVAQDLDRIRIALGEQKISYYGISWGTSLGAVYRSRYDDHVDRMLLDSVMTPDFSLKTMNDDQVGAAEANFLRFSQWAATNEGRYHLGDSAEAVSGKVIGLARQLDQKPRSMTAPDGTPVRFDGDRLRTIMSYQQARWADMAATVVALRDNGIPPLLGDPRENPAFGLRDSDWDISLMQVSVLCNDQGPDPDVDTLWWDELRRRAKYPLFGALAGYQHWCAGWPLPAQPTTPRRGSSELQLVGHRYEPVTPYRWAQDMRERIGGALLTVEDEKHGSLDRIACGSKAVEFFSIGRTDNGTC